MKKIKLSKFLDSYFIKSKDVRKVRVISKRRVLIYFKTGEQKLIEVMDPIEIHGTHIKWRIPWFR